MEDPRTIGHVISVNGFRIKIEITQDAKSPSRATPDGVQKAVAINSFLSFEIGASVHAIGILTDLDARESYDPKQGGELSLELTKPRRTASVQLLGTVKPSDKCEKDQSDEKYLFDPGITVLPTLDTPAKIAHPDILKSVFAHPPKRNKPAEEVTDYDYNLPIGRQTGDENVKIHASFNDLFSRPLAIVGNTGSGKSYTVASLLSSAINSVEAKAKKKSDPHIFILDINGEYASAFSGGCDYAREPNHAYINGKPFCLPLWLMNTQEICEWLSAAEQTQQPVLRDMWSRLKANNDQTEIEDAIGYCSQTLSSIAVLKSELHDLKCKAAWSKYENIKSFALGAGLKETNDSLCKLEGLIQVYKGTSGYDTNTISNPAEIAAASVELTQVVNNRIEELSEVSASVTSADSPIYFPLNDLYKPENFWPKNSGEDIAKLSGYLTTLRLRLKSRLDDKRWSILTAYDKEFYNIKSLHSWYLSVCGGSKNAAVSIIDLSMISTEVLPYICSVIGRVFLEMREQLPSSKRYKNPWLLVLEEAHNYARPHRQVEDRGQALSRHAFERIAKEGRKFGLSLIVASQRPSEISPTIISQCANFISHRLQNPDDIEHFRKIIPKQAQRLLDQVTVLTAGEAITFGSAFHVPARVQINEPVKVPSSMSATPYVEWKNSNKFPIDEVIKNWGVESINIDQDTKVKKQMPYKPVKESIGAHKSERVEKKDSGIEETETKA